MRLNLSGRRGLAMVVPALVAVLVAACGSSAKSGSASKTRSATASATATSSDAGASPSQDALSVTKGSAGTYLVGAKGRSIYLWEADTKD